MSDEKGFQTICREETPRRAPAERLRDWSEVDCTPRAEFMQTQSQRCMDCGVAFCQSETGCPVYNQIPEWNRLAAQGRWEEAAIRLHATNNFPELTGRLCPAPCESACVLGVHSDAVNIRAIEWGIVERAFAEGWIRPRPARAKTGKRVAIIGSGPSGLAAAQQLARKGHEVTVFEREAKPGGLLRYGIPDFKMHKDLIDRRLSQLESEGVVFRCGMEFGRDFTYDDAKRGFDALALTIGAEQPRDLTIPGRELRGIHFAMDFLRAQNQVLAGERAEPPFSARGKRVVILGGGDTGSDCLGTALRQGARDVLQLEIQPRPPLAHEASSAWPSAAAKLKTSHAHEEGGRREWGWATETFQGEGGEVRALIARRVSAPLESRTFEADLVILALGFTGVRGECLASIPDLLRTSRGTIATENFATSVPGVFAAGDARRGASLIVWAIAEGRQMAQAIDSTFKLADLSGAHTACLRG